MYDIFRIIYLILFDVILRILNTFIDELLKSLLQVLKYNLLNDIFIFQMKDLVKNFSRQWVPDIYRVTSSSAFRARANIGQQCMGEFHQRADQAE